MSLDQWFVLWMGVIAPFGMGLGMVFWSHFYRGHPEVSQDQMLRMTKAAGQPPLSQRQMAFGNHLGHFAYFFLASVFFSFSYVCLIGLIAGPPWRNEMLYGGVVGGVLTTIILMSIRTQWEKPKPAN
ncbi:MAG: hypothetical protein HYT10_01405 [Candidatus Levybacteria bacterium]|nr:hypothetical protein [Candidatus Levybacteria bacterium]